MGFKLNTTCFDTMLNLSVASKAILLENNEFNHLTIILTSFSFYVLNLFLM
jgi:hypothetical protein